MAYLKPEYTRLSIVLGLYEKVAREFMSCVSASNQNHDTGRCSCQITMEQWNSRWHCSNTGTIEAYTLGTIKTRPFDGSIDSQKRVVHCTAATIDFLS